MPLGADIKKGHPEKALETLDLGNRRYLRIHLLRIFDGNFNV